MDKIIIRLLTGKKDKEEMNIYNGKGVKKWKGKGSVLL